MPTDLTDSLVTLCESIWTDTFGLRLSPAPASASPDPSVTVEGCVHVSGAWSGLVLVQCSLPLAWLAATKLFRLDDQAPTDEEVREAVGELTSTVAARVTALYSGAGCDLSAPMVIEGHDFNVRVPGALLVAGQRFTSDGEWMVVSVLQPLAAAA